MDHAYKDFITEAFNSFTPTDNAKTRWETANRLIRELGGNALNIGCLEQSTNRPLWMLSSMSDEWLKKYTDEKLYEIDPFIPHMMATNKPIVLDTRKTDKSQPLNEMLLAAGYRFLYGMPFNGVRAGERQVVTYCSDLAHDAEGINAHLARIRMLASILITQFSAADHRDSDTIEHFGRNQLTPREKQTLRWLADGLRNDHISAKMGISEVMVRKHLLSARDKLGASTREQALGIALYHGMIEL